MGLKEDTVFIHDFKFSCIKRQAKSRMLEDCHVETLVTIIDQLVDLVEKQEEEFYQRIRTACQADD